MHGWSEGVITHLNIDFVVIFVAVAAEGGGEHGNERIGQRGVWPVLAL